MMRALLIGIVATFALPAAAQDYYATTAQARHGNGYAPSVVVAGWEGETSFKVISITPDGKRTGGKGVGGQAAAGIPADTEWKATLVTGPRKPPEDNDEEDDRYLDRAATSPARAAPAGPPVPRREVLFSSLTCPAVMARMTALKPLAAFEFDPPALKGNKDGPNGDGREGFDLWMRVGDAELNRSAETANSALGRWFDETERALAACPSSVAPKG